MNRRIHYSGIRAVDPRTGGLGDFRIKLKEERSRSFRKSMEEMRRRHDRWMEENSRKHKLWMEEMCRLFGLPKPEAAQSHRAVTEVQPDGLNVTPSHCKLAFNSLNDVEYKDHQSYLGNLCKNVEIDELEVLGVNENVDLSQSVIEVHELNVFDEMPRSNLGENEILPLFDEMLENSSGGDDEPVYDVYDDDIFDGLPGLKNKSASSTVTFEDDVFASISTPQSSTSVNKNNDFDDLLGNLGRNEKAGENMRSSSVKGSSNSEGFDDLFATLGRDEFSSTSDYSQHTQSPKTVSQFDELEDFAMGGRPQNSTDESANLSSSEGTNAFSAAAAMQEAMAKAEEEAIDDEEGMKSLQNTSIEKVYFKLEGLSNPNSSFSLVLPRILLKWNYPLIEVGYVIGEPNEVKMLSRLQCFDVSLNIEELQVLYRMFAQGMVRKGTCSAHCYRGKKTHVEDDGGWSWLCLTVQMLPQLPFPPPEPPPQQL